MEKDIIEKDSLEKYGQVEDIKPANNPRGNIFHLPIIGHIEGHGDMGQGFKTTKYEHIIPILLNAAQDPTIHGMLVTLNTAGGDVEAGLAIAELIAHFTKPTVSLVLGGGHSIGVPLAVSAEYSIISPTAAMTIHPVRMSGTMIGSQETYDYFNKMQERILSFVADHSGIDKDRFKQLMMDTSTLSNDTGTVLVGQEVVREGLIDQVGGLKDAMEKLYENIAKGCEM
ncbi:MAG: ATP-dependent Clp protease proteolytic subunit [Defluviitaleaceae bacterium]|nr:ATP-dependent Clp protease proteolytic subunit [Defluviitaleaceae bacterium]